MSTQCSPLSLFRGVGIQEAAVAVAHAHNACAADDVVFDRYREAIDLGIEPVYIGRQRWRRLNYLQSFSSEYRPVDPTTTTDKYVFLVLHAFESLRTSPPSW